MALCSLNDSSRFYVCSTYHLSFDLTLHLLKLCNGAMLPCIIWLGLGTCATKSSTYGAFVQFSPFECGFATPLALILLLQLLPLLLS